MKILSLALLLFSTAVFSQSITDEIDNDLQDDIQSRFTGQYSFSKRVLTETDFMKTYREKRITEDKAYISPDEIRFDIHTFGFRYKSSSKLSFEAGGSYMKSSVNLTGERPVGFYTPRGAPPSVRVPVFGRVSEEYGSSGLADSRVGAIYKAYENDRHSIVTSTHLNIPTGSVEEEEDGYRFPYAGQLGSGTYDLMPEIKYNYGKTGLISGAKVKYTLRTGRNESGYRMGNQALFDSFIGYDYKRWAALIFKGRIRDWKATSDPRYTSVNARIDDPYVQEGRRWEVLATARTGIPLPWQLGAVILEGGVPIYQDQKAGEVQLETAWYITTRMVASF